MPDAFTPDEQDDYSDPTIPPVVSERRQRLRRAEDTDRVVEHWAAWLVRNKLKLLSVVAAVSAFVGSLATSMGFRLYGPPQDIAAVRVEYKSADSAIVVRVVRLEDGKSSMDARMGAVERKLDLLTFITCVGLRRTDPAMVPPDCQTVIQARGNP